MSGDESGSRRSSAMDDRRPSLRRVDQENLLKVRRDSKSRRPSLADVVPDWPTLQKVKRPEKVKIKLSELFIQQWTWIDFLNFCMNVCHRLCMSM